jgi:segregation and condensation protein B
MEEVEQPLASSEQASDAASETELEASVAADPGAEDQIVAPEEENENGTGDDRSGDESFFEDILAESVHEPALPAGSATLKAVIEAAIYITDEPLTAQQIATAVEQPLDAITEILEQLVAEYSAADRGLSIRELAGGYQMATKPEYHESIRQFVKKLQPPLKLSLAALETLAVVAYKQPITAPEIMDVRGVQGAGVLKTLLDRKLIAAAGRKNVLGKPILYKTTRDFLIQFGLNSLAELPTLKEFEELGRLALDIEETIETETGVQQSSVPGDQTDNQESHPADA